MGQPTPNFSDTAERHGFSPEAVETLYTALVSGRGTMAQFSHPELGGNGQWMRGGMLTIGDMWNSELKARVNRLAAELADLVQRNPIQESEPGFSFQTPATNWWRAELGSPSVTGSQNSMRYAFFPSRKRLAVLDNGRVTLYDTGDREIIGVSQAQSSDYSLTFTDRDGTVRLADLIVHDSDERAGDDA